jgi:hypothetical protein
MRVSKRSGPAVAGVQQEAELVVVMRPQAAFRHPPVVHVRDRRKSDRVAKVLARHGATLKPIFGPRRRRVMARQAAHSVAAHAPMEDLSVFYKVEGSE